MAYNYLFPIAVALLLFIVGAGLYLVYHFGKPVIKSLFLRKRIQAAVNIISNTADVDARINLLKEANLTDEDIIKTALAKIDKTKVIQHDNRQSKGVDGEAKIQAEERSSGGSDGRTERREADRRASPEVDNETDPRHEGSRAGDGESDRGIAEESRYFT